MIETINKFARLASARSEVVGASLVILMVVMMVLPLSPMMLDILLAVNISIAILLAISAVLIETPLAFSSFPAILLMTTLFRLSLTISTTRQILLEADAGHIVQTFGEFVVGGNIAVGLTIFIIISVVNFLVVTKGSERVAEVAARFSLDGMPGKQMSIDSDLRSGLINQSMAKQKRANLEKESQLFGAMDGAIKFVKNDAIAGLVITGVNLLGGLAVGMLQKDMSFSQAANIYSILSVGDGLVAIIPSLLISVAAGLIVTRVTKGEEEGSSTASDMFKDLSRNSNALQISGVFCLLFAFVPGMPAPVFVITSLAFFAGWYFMSGKDEKPKEINIEQQFTDLMGPDHRKALEDVTTTDTYAPLQIRVPEDVEPTVINQIQNICRIARNRQVEQLGIVLPLFDLTRHREAYAEVYVFGVPALSLNLSEKRMSILEPTEKIQNFDAQIEFAVEKDKTTGRYHHLCEPTFKPRLDQHGLVYKTYESRLLEQVEILLVSRIHQMFTLNEYQRHLVSLGDRFAEQLKELERVLPTTKVVEVLQKLMRERVSIKNLRTIFNSLIEWGQRERDVDVITEQVRRSLHEQICHQYSQSKTMRILLLDVEFEQIIRESVRSQGSNSYLDIDSSSINEMVAMIEQQMGPYLHEDLPPAIVCSMDCRIHIRQMIERSLFCIPVLSHQEVSSNLEIQVLGNIAITELHSSNR
ncbi:MAG: type III secretion system export apparatus subunit SctV [Limnobacter sp.]|uniref:type III secretion system export apparatus subunit SctV n=1 Tax=Limnobacter sp. TaxID=2003368 RepID=UPI0022CAE24C|nr:type III secretion system export apparatus subunit SctV [Limnobacter sp.]MCZ8016154.1 type III secretion system export apparatus subunit SctV [Limnobacter sp.]